MRRRPQPSSNKAIRLRQPENSLGNIGFVLSGGGARAAYQVGALRALAPFVEKDGGKVTVVVGSSIGAINGLILAAGLKEGMPQVVQVLEKLWRERSFRNTFLGSPSAAFVRAIKMAVWQYMSPGPNPTSEAIFDPTPLMEAVDQVIQDFGGLAPESRHPDLQAVAVMTTLEGLERKPMLFVNSHKPISDEVMVGASFEICQVQTITAKHGFASAALPSVLPPVELDTQHGRFRLVDGGISQNVPVDPATRLGAERVIVIDISGRSWWLDRYGESHDKRPDWEVPAAHETFCMRPPDTFVVRNQRPFGPLLKQAVQGSTRKFITAVGPTWPVFKLLKTKLGEEVAYEVMSYVALDRDYLQGLMERGYNETMHLLRNRKTIEFQHNESFEEVAEAL